MKPPTREYYNWYAHRCLDAAIGEAARGLRGSVLLDVGCGQRPYGDYFAHFDHYIGIDRPNRPDSGDAPTVLGDAAALPIAESVADVVLCTEVMEHVPDPRALLAEIRRTLVAGGILILSVPFTWHIHDEPHDYWRFTEYGLRRILEDGGFEVDLITPVNGFLGALLQSWAYAVRFGLGRRLAFLGRPLIWFLQAMAVALAKLDRNTRATSNYVVRARKPR